MNRNRETAEKLEMKWQLRAHRVGKKVQPRPQSKKGHGSHVESASTPRPCPIIAKIQSWKVKENILRTARKKKPKNVLFLTDFSQRTLEKRTENIPRMLEERKKGNVAFLHMDKLIVYENKRRNKTQVIMTMKLSSKDNKKYPLTVQAVRNVTLISQNEPKRSRANSYELFRRFPNSQINS